MLLRRNVIAKGSGFILSSESMKEGSETMATLNSFAGLGGGNGETSRGWAPALDVWETDNELV
jgi:hypothetical protein